MKFQIELYAIVNVPPRWEKLIGSLFGEHFAVFLITPWEFLIDQVLVVFQIDAGDPQLCLVLDGSVELVERDDEALGLGATKVPFYTPLRQ